MTTDTTTRTEVRVDIRDEVSKFSLRIGMALAAIIGIWGVSCLVGALAGNGVSGTLKGFMTAITG